MEKRKFIKSHTDLVNFTISEINCRFKEAKVFKRHVGMFVPIWAVKRYGSVDLLNMPRIRINLKGMADITGWIKGLNHPIPIEIEMKWKNDRQKPEQKTWQNMCQNFGVPYFLAKSTDDALSFIEEIINNE